MRIAIKVFGDAAESLLSCSVPDLKFDVFIVEDLDTLDSIISAYFTETNIKNGF